MDVLHAVPKSQAAIYRAFIDLMGEMPFAAIRVKDIATRSGLGRTTFYLHFEDKEDLLDKLEDLLAAGFLQVVNDVRSKGPEDFREKIESGFHPGFAGYFAFLRENREAYTALFKPQEGVSLVGKLEKSLAGLSEVYMKPHKPLDPDTYAFYDGPMVSQYVKLFADWVNGGMAIDDNAMAAMVTSFWKGLLFDDNSITNYLLDKHDRSGA